MKPKTKREKKKQTKSITGDRQQLSARLLQAPVRVAQQQVYLTMEEHTYHTYYQYLHSGNYPDGLNKEEKRDVRKKLVVTRVETDGETITEEEIETRPEKLPGILVTNKENLQAVYKYMDDDAVATLYATIKAKQDDIPGAGCMSRMCGNHSRWT
ncbi:hypothetical protein Pmani_039351 [Petrolisthes manimaculis]|uniref:Uncharacterized protein n=1 Tax=Petrolisthes manimaculis TaxID=1843537 RepID=A0AAE1TJK0_9EUCA|nr:hypothetical protein Pmani_039351 [Petrolisthes manimaculis]